MTMRLIIALLATALAACSSPDPFNECMLRCMNARTPYPQGGCLDLCEHGAVGGGGEASDGDE